MAVNKYKKVFEQAFRELEEEGFFEDFGRALDAASDDDDDCNTEVDYLATYKKDDEFSDFIEDDE